MRRIRSTTRPASAPVAEPVVVTRVVAASSALDSLTSTPEATILRLSADEALVLDGAISVDDPHALVLEDHGWIVKRLDEAELRVSLAELCAWEPQPGLNQGMVAGLPAKVWIAGDRSFMIVPAGFAAEVEERWR